MVRKRRDGDLQRRVVQDDFLAPINQHANVPGIDFRSGWESSFVGPGIGPKSAVGRKRLCVFGSTPIVPAPYSVLSVSIFRKLPGRPSSVAPPDFGRTRMEDRLVLSSL